MQKIKAGRTLAAIAAAILVAGPVLAGGAGKVAAGTGSTVTSGTGVAVTTGTAPSTTIVTPAGTTVMGVGPALTHTTTVSARTWPEMPPNVEGRSDFRRWMSLK